MNYRIVIAFVLFMIPLEGKAEWADGDSVSVRDTSTALTIQSSPSGVIVFDGDSCLGTTPLVNIKITGGIHVLHYVYPDGRDWMHPAMSDTITVHPNEVIRKQVQFPFLTLVTSEPYGATVTMGDSVLGTTPFAFFRSQTTAGTLILSRKGYKSEILSVPSQEHELHIILRKDLGYDSLKEMDKTFLVEDRSGNSLPAVITTGAAVLAGATATYYKVKADRFYNDYQSTGNGEALENVRKYDKVAGISLFVCQVNLFLLAYYLFSK